MSVSHLYQDFNTNAPKINDGLSATEDEMEDVKLASFEDGYQAGWEDAIKAQQHTEEKLSAEFLQCVQDMSFTYQEAFSKLSAGIRPLMTSFVTKLLPEVAEHGLGPQIIAQLNDLLKAESNEVIEIAVGPEMRPTIEKLLCDQAAIPFNVVAEPALSNGQIYLRAGQIEREIDFDAITDSITSAIDAFFHTTEQEIRHG